MEQKKRTSAVRRDAFIVRIWQKEGQPGWQGWVQHVRSGQSTAVYRAEELVTFIEEQVKYISQTARNGLK